MATEEIIQTLSLRAACTYTEEKPCIYGGIICISCLLHGCHYLKIRSLTNSANKEAEAPANHCGFVKTVMCGACDKSTCDRSPANIEICLATPPEKTPLERLSSKHS